MDVEPPTQRAPASAVPIRPNGLMPAQLTFGTGLLSGRTGPATARRVLDAALDCGIMRIDTARAYGDGETERVVGAALRRRPDVAVITKAGLGPLDRRVVSAARWRALGPATGLLPNRGGARALPGDEESDEQQTTRMDEASLRASIDLSRRALLRERIDLVLLHELDAGPSVVEVVEVVEVMDSLVEEGVIGAWGVGTRRAALRRLVASGARLGGLVQTTGGPLLPPAPVPAGVPLSVHSVLGPGAGLLSAFLEWLGASPHRDLWERSVGPLAARRTAGDALIRVAVSDPRLSAVLVSTRDPRAIAPTAVAVRAGETEERLRLLRPVLAAFRERVV